MIYTDAFLEPALARDEDAAVLFTAVLIALLERQDGIWNELTRRDAGGAARAVVGVVRAPHSVVGGPGSALEAHHMDRETELAEIERFVEAPGVTE